MRHLIYLTLLVILLTGCANQNDGADANPTPPPLDTPGQPTAIVQPTTTPAPRAPTPTFVPTAVAGAPPTEAPSPTPAPPDTAPTATPPGEAPTTAPTTAASPTTIRLEDTAWTGGYRNRGDSVYGGRTATWIYGRDTQFNTMQATFLLAPPAEGEARLVVEGMDDEIGPKSEIEISVNGQTIFTGPNPLPNDDQPLESGTWAQHTWTFDAALLVAGQNTITIRNRSPGERIGRPPFFMLDYADLNVSVR